VTWGSGGCTHGIREKEDAEKEKKIFLPVCVSGLFGDHGVCPPALSGRGEVFLHHGSDGGIYRREKLSGCFSESGVFAGGEEYGEVYAGMHPHSGFGGAYYGAFDKQTQKERLPEIGLPVSPCNAHRYRGDGVEAGVL